MSCEQNKPYRCEHLNKYGFRKGTSWFPKSKIRLNFLQVDLYWCEKMHLEKEIRFKLTPSLFYIKKKLSTLCIKVYLLEKICVIICIAKETLVS